MRMKLPKEVNILGLTYEVREVDIVDKMQPAYGEIDYEAQVIKIDISLSDERKGQVFMHELLHGILEALNYVSLNNDENAVQSISATLYHVLSGQAISFS